MHNRHSAIIIVVILVATIVSASGCLRIRPLPAGSSTGSQKPLTADQPGSYSPPAPAATPATTPPSTTPSAPSPRPPTPDNSGRIIRTGAIPVVTGIAPGTKRVALTFDAGWIYETAPALLATLDKYGVKSTFFLRAGSVVLYSDQVVWPLQVIGIGLFFDLVLTQRWTDVADDKISLSTGLATAAFGTRMSKRFVQISGPLIAPLSGICSHSASGYFGAPVRPQRRRSS